MKILFVSPYFKPYLGGIERVIEKLAKEFLQSGKVEKVGVLTTKWSFPRNYRSDWKDYETIDGVEVFRISSWSHTAPPFSQVPLVWFSPLAIKKAIEQFQPNIIQIMSDKWVWGNFWAWFFGRSKAKIVYSLSFHKLSSKQKWLVPFNFFLTRVADKVQVITNYEKGLVKKAYFTPEKRIVVIPWGMETKVQSSKFKVQSHPSRLSPRFGEAGQLASLAESRQAEADNSKFKIDKGSVVILCVGRLSKHKGQMWLLERYREIVENLSKPTKLVFIGAKESKQSTCLRRQAINNPPDGRAGQQSTIGGKGEIIVTGEIPQNELDGWYRKSDIFALFPEYEAFGLVFLEAMAHGVPVLTHKVGAIEEVLDDAAMLIEPYNAAQAKVALTKLIEDDEFRQQLGQKGYGYVQKKFSWQKTAEKFLNLYA